MVASASGSEDARDDRSGSPTGSPLRGVARERAILKAAVELVSEVGYENVTMDMIGVRAKASKATMYRRWPDKAVLLATALKRHAKRPALRLKSSDSLRGDLLATVANMSQIISADNGPTLAGFVQAIGTDAELRGMIRTQIEQEAETGAAVLAERASARGEPVRSNTEHIFELAVGALLSRALLYGAGRDEKYEEYLVDEVLLPLFRLVT